MGSRPTSMFRDLVYLLLPIIVAVVAGNAALTYTAEAADPVAQYRLSGRVQKTMPVPYWLDGRFTRPEIEALHAAFDQWQHDSGSRVTFRYMGTVPDATASPDDGRNVVVRSAEALPRRRGDTIATTVRTPGHDGGDQTGRRTYADVDIVIDFSGRVAWSTSGERGEYDLQSVAAHEVGHLLGLDDVSDPGPLMYWLSAPGDLGRHYARWGDLEGLARAYPTVAIAGGT